MQLILNLKQRARQLKSEAQVLMTAYTDKRTPFTAKILMVNSWLFTKHRNEIRELNEQGGIL